MSSNGFPVDLAAQPAAVVNVAARAPHAAVVSLIQPSVVVRQPAAAAVTIPGIPGPPGPPGTMIIAVPYDQWPPAAPQPDTLYLRLAE
jgi:hypothetical protein